MTRSLTLKMMVVVGRLGKFFLLYLFFFYLTLIRNFFPLSFTVRLRRINELLSVLQLQRYVNFAQVLGF